MKILYIYLENPLPDLQHPARRNHITQDKRVSCLVVAYTENHSGTEQDLKRIINLCEINLKINSKIVKNESRQDLFDSITDFRKEA